MRENSVLRRLQHLWLRSPRGGRYDENTRWTKRLRRAAGRRLDGGRGGLSTGAPACMDDPTEGGYKSGASYLPPCLMSHNPLDMVVHYAGRQRFQAALRPQSPVTIGEGIMQLIRLTRLYGRGRGGQSVRKFCSIAPAAVSWRSCADTRYWDVFGPQALGGHARAGRGVRPGGAAAAVRISGRGRGGEAVGD